MKTCSIPSVLLFHSDTKTTIFMKGSHNDSNSNNILSGNCFRHAARRTVAPRT
jgi:hypothetical protein